MTPRPHFATRSCPITVGRQYYYPDHGTRSTLQSIRFQGSPPARRRHRVQRTATSSLHWQDQHELCDFDAVRIPQIETSPLCLIGWHLCQRPSVEEALVADRTTAAAAIFPEAGTRRTRRRAEETAVPQDAGRRVADSCRRADDFGDVFPTLFTSNAAQINVYDVLISGLGDGDIVHFDLYNHVQAKGKASSKYVFAPFSHDGEGEIDDDVVINEVPEPTSIALLATGAVGALVMGRGRREQGEQVA
jgi:hypothetical protein